jgi:hypothetical protein
MNLPPIRPPLMPIKTPLMPIKKPLMPIKTPQKSNEIINKGKTLAAQKSYLKIGIV